MTTPTVSQLFKNNVPNELVEELLKTIAAKIDDKYYLLNYSAFKKGVFLNVIQPFFDTCMPYYHISKRKYLEKKLTYNSFTTVIRQICNFNDIKYTSQIKYDKSSYDIVYCIYL